MDFYKRIKELVEMMKDFDLTEIEIKDGEREVRIKKGKTDAEKGIDSLPQALVNPGMAMTQAPQPVAVGNPQPAAAAEAPPVRDPNLVEFKSPMVGTFYGSPSPESPPYVNEGDRVNKETVLCIIEAMKVMNEIKAETNGELVEILVENGEAVEFGQPMFLIRTAG